jgi:protease-4
MRGLRAAHALLFCGALCACEGRPRAASLRGEGRDEAKTGPSVAVFDLSDGAPEQPQAGLLGISPKGASLADLVHAVEVLQRGTDARAADVRGVLVRLGSAQIGLGRATEIGDLLTTLGATMPVWCHADAYTNATLALAARGCKRIWIAPASSVDAIGIAAQTIYFHKLLTEEIGLDIDFLQVGKFKGAEEPFTRDGPSPEARESLESTLGDLRAGWLESFTRGRPAAPPSSPEDGPYAPNEARGVGLVDDVGYFDEARSALEAATGAKRWEARLGAGAQAGGDGLSDVLKTLAGDSLGTAPVALVEATGAISLEAGSNPLGGSSGIAEERLIRTLLRLEHDDDVKAVVLRIDSPGGSALASDLLWHELMTIRKKKTLVVSVGDMAASGGYYLASTGAVVFADPTSIVGSIGVVGGKISGGKLLERLGIHAETFPAKTGDAQAAARAASESVLSPWDDATRERVLATMTGIYDLFLARVSEGRNIPVEKVAASAEGRIFSGRDGKARGLVDELGGLREAIARARSMASLEADAEVEVAAEPTGLLATLAGDGAESSAGGISGLLFGGGLPGVGRPGGGWPGGGWLLGAGGPLGGGGLPGAGVGVPATHAITAPATQVIAAAELLPFIASLLPLETGEHALCALPFALTVR